MTDHEVLAGRPLPRLTPRARLAGQDAAAIAEHVAAHYVAGRSIRAIASDTGRSYGWVHRQITVIGAPMRPRGNNTRPAR